jgi:7,8-dihydropterin-6-yl-methyl-4-(beta-D-ribofuranosyl)aminobenzene 5'-phosphate synthase
MSIAIKEVDRVEILTLQDNYIDLVAGDNTDIIQRASFLKGLEFRNTILAEHGFAALITIAADSSTHTMLFDFGFSEFGAAFNAEALAADLSSVEALALSHVHNDHTGGFDKLVGMIGKKGIPFVVHPAGLRDSRYVKISEDFKILFPPLTREQIQSAGVELVESSEPYSLFNDSLLFLGEIPRKTDYEQGLPNAYFEENGEEKKDNFEDDTGIVMNLKGKGLVVLSGCAHAGIINTVTYAREITGINKVHVVMGGFHLTGPQLKPIIQPTTESLKAIGPDYVIPTHCTGRNAVNYIEKEMPNQFLLNMVGTKLTFTA